MNFLSDNAYLYKVNPVYVKDNFGKDTDEVKFYRLTFRTCQVSNNALATINYFDLIPSKALEEKYGDTWSDMVGKVFKIRGFINKTYDKEAQKGYTNYYLHEISA